MKITLQNLGIIRYAEFMLADLTIICGKNNTGKTYATYAFFGFLYYWRKLSSVKISNKIVEDLLNNGSVKLDINQYIEKFDRILLDTCNKYLFFLPDVFASSPRYFDKTSFNIEILNENLDVKTVFSRTYRSQSTELLVVELINENELSISLLTEQKNITLEKNIIVDLISECVLDIIFADNFPNPFILSAERTGAAIFRRELDFTRNKILSKMASLQEDNKQLKLLSSVYTEYALPVKLNVDFARNLGEYTKSTSFLAESFPEIFSLYHDLLGGSFAIDKNGLLSFTPAQSSRKLSLVESSSGVRSLLGLGFYLRHKARPGDLLLIDEPELDLHPANQRRMAQLLGMIVNAGIKVFITTHSDYIIKEINTLIMLNQSGNKMDALIDRENYSRNSLINPDNVKAYIAKNDLVAIPGQRRRQRINTLSMARVDKENGIEINSFDETINDMNRIQDEILWG